MAEQAKKDLLEFAANTTCHGISGVAQSKSVFWRVVWALALLGAGGFLISQCYALFVKYKAYPVNTKIEVKHNPLPFPSVTICNLNPFRKTALRMKSSTDPSVLALQEAFLRLVVSSKSEKEVSSH